MLMGGSKEQVSRRETFTFLLLTNEAALPSARLLPRDKTGAVRQGGLRAGLLLEAASHSRLKPILKPTGCENMQPLANRRATLDLTTDGRRPPVTAKFESPFSTKERVLIAFKFKSDPEVSSKLAWCSNGCSRSSCQEPHD
jgi:hypothetical protein